MGSGTRSPGAGEPEMLDGRTDMVDRVARRELAELLRQLTAGHITNDEFERRAPRPSADPAIQAICRDGAWFLYDDLHEHRLVGKYRVDGRVRSDVARWVLFLETDIEYQWPIPPVPWRLVLVATSLATLGLLAVIMRWRNRRDPDSAVWPFRTVAAYESALRRPPYLNGAV